MPLLHKRLKLNPCTCRKVCRLLTISDYHANMIQIFISFVLTFESTQSMQRMFTTFHMIIIQTLWNLVNLLDLRNTNLIQIVSGGNNIYQSTPPPPPLLLHPEFSALIENGAVVQPLPPEIALRLPLNEFPQLSVEAHVLSNEVPPLSVRPKLSPVRVLAESSGASSSSVTSSRYALSFLNKSTFS